MTSRGCSSDSANWKTKSTNTPCSTELVASRTHGVGQPKSEPRPSASPLQNSGPVALPAGGVSIGAAATA